MRGSVTKYKQKNGRVSWGFHFRPGKDADGKWIRITKQGFKTKGEAEDKLDEAKKEYKNARDPQQPAPAVGPPDTFAEFFGVWMKEYAQRHCEPKTTERYGELGRYAIAHFGDVPLRGLTAFTLERAFNQLSDHGGQKSEKFPEGRRLAPKTVREIAFLVFRVLQKAKAWDKIDSNPADFEKITLPKAEKRKAAVVEKENFKIFIDRAKTTRLYALLILAGATGARRGELLALQWPDINLQSGLMLVTKSLEETKAGLRIKSTKNGEPRSFIVPRQALEVLAAHRVQQEQDKRDFAGQYEDNNLIFCRPDGAYYRPDKVSVRVTKLAQKCGLPKGVGLHALRHTHASELLSKGVPITVVSERLGHANPNVTLSIYAHALKADELAAAKVWEDAMADVIETQMKKPGPTRVSGNVMADSKKSA